MCLYDGLKVYLTYNGMKTFKAVYQKPKGGMVYIH